MKMVEPEFVGSIPCRCTLGESPVWDERLQCLWWTDILEGKLYSWDWASKEVRTFTCPERLCSLGLTNDVDWLICAFESGLALFNPTHEQVRWIVRPELPYRGIRFNDGRVDRRGNFWIGTMVENAELAEGKLGSLYRLSPDGRLDKYVEGIGISNGIASSLSGDKLWLADSSIRQIWQFPVDAKDHSLGDRCDFAKTSGDVAPDGSDLDSEGCLWNAEWGGSSVARYLMNGNVSLRLPVPVSQPTCIAFGGTELDCLFVTSARQGLSNTILEGEDEAGNTLIYRSSVKGLVAPKFSFAGFT